MSSTAKTLYWPRLTPRARLPGQEMIAQRPEVGWVIGALIACGLGCFFLADGQSQPNPQRQLQLLALAFYGAAALLWWLEHVYPQGSALVAIAFVFLVVYGGYYRLSLPGLLLLISLPTLVTVLFFGLRMGGAVALLESLALVSGLAGSEPDLVPFALLAVWLALAVMVAAIKPWRQATAWAWTNFAEAQQKLDAARERNADLDSVLNELLYANRQLNLLNERIATLRAVAEEAQRTKAAFVAKVSHEFRTPLNMIIGLTDLLVERPEVYGERLPPELLEDLRVVHHNCAHLAGMVNDVLDLSQIEAGRLTLHRQWADLREEIHLAADAVRPLAAKKGLDLQVNLPVALPEVYYDRVRIRQVLLNLLSNAARYTVAGAITVAVRQEQHEVTICVSDTGPGIPPEDVERIFEPFFQGAQATGRTQEGNGLGLSISKQLVEQHDGRLWLESKVGSGTTFFLHLPVCPLAAPIARPEGWIREEWIWLQRENRPATPILPPRQRMIAYDATGGLQKAFEVLAEDVELIETRTLADVQAELELAPAHAILINCGTVSDLLPLLEQLRQQAPDTPLIGSLLPSPVDQAVVAGAFDYLTKPVTRADLCAVLAAVKRPLRRVLIIDDDANVRQLLARMLRSDNPQLEVSLAEDGAAARIALATHPIDIVLLDIMLGNSTGWELLAQIRQDNAWQDIPVIIISALDPAEQPTSSMVVATMGQGVPIEKLTRCIQAFSNILLAPA